MPTCPECGDLYLGHQEFNLYFCAHGHVWHEEQNRDLSPS